MLQPKKTKFRRMQKGRMKGIAQRGNQLAYGSFAIKALDSAWITGRQIEAARQAITRYMKREGQLWIRIFPDKPITKKPAEVRMGKGKGNPEGFVAPVTPGRILFEAEGVPLPVAQDEKCRNKGPVGQGASGAHRRGEGAAFETQVAARSFADREPVYNQKIPQRHRAHADNSASEKP